MSISSIKGQFPLLFRLLCVPKQIGEPLWGPSLPVLSFACITQDPGRFWIYGERVLKPLGSELGAGRLAHGVIKPPCCGQQMAAQSVYILLSSLVKKSCCRSLTKISPCRSKWPVICCRYCWRGFPENLYEGRTHSRHLLLLPFTPYLGMEVMITSHIGPWGSPGDRSHVLR